MSGVVVEASRHDQWRRRIWCARCAAETPHWIEVTDSRNIRICKDCDSVSVPHPPIKIPLVKIRSIMERLAIHLQWRKR
jgi:NMD protein affecting ribosome stability and mRNA decay